MSSFFTLTLDTTPPTFEIYSPQYTQKEIETEIRIVANENLSINHEIYLIDSLGERYNYTFLLSDNEFIGKVQFTNVNYGIATIYVTVYDEVLNKSSLLSKAINIIGGQKLKLDINDFTNVMIIKDKTYDTNINTSFMPIQSNIIEMKTKINSRVREIKVLDSEVN